MSLITMENEVFLKLKEMLIRSIGKDEAEILRLAITRESKFTKDLMMDSIQVVAFAEQVNQLYGERVDFHAWLSQKSVPKLMKLTVGDVSSFIAENL